MNKSSVYRLKYVFITWQLAVIHISQNINKIMIIRMAYLTLCGIVLRCCLCYLYVAECVRRLALCQASDVSVGRWGKSISWKSGFSVTHCSSINIPCL